jgi:acetylglutamate kinase
MKFCSAMDNLYVIKIGGNIIDDEEKLSSFLHAFALIKGRKILIHGGGKLATNLAQQLNIPQQMIEGRRITDPDTLKVITMVYAGYINKNITALLQSGNCNAIGLCGADGNLIKAHRRVHPTIDYGLVGDIDRINSKWLQQLLNDNLVPVIAPVSHDKNGQLLNTNADTIAQEIAKSMATQCAVTLIYCFEKKGVLQMATDEHSVINEIDPTSYKDLKQKQIIHSGMIPKLDNAFAALANGVKKVIIGKAEELGQLIAGTSGTTIVNE